MIPGLPITGVGALFYLLLTLYIPIRELNRAARGRQSAQQTRNGLRTFLRQMLMQSGVIATLFLQAGLLILIAPAMAAKGVNVPVPRGDDTQLVDRTASMVTGGLIAGGVMLLTIFIFVQGVRFFLRLKAHVEDGEELLGG